MAAGASVMMQSKRHIAKRKKKRYFIETLSGPKLRSPLSPKSHKQKESALQRLIIEVLNTNHYGHYFRIRNGATFDPKAGIFRSNTAEKGISDILGWTNHNPPIAVAIEVKYFETIEKRRKVTHKVKISEEQMEFLYKLHKAGGRAGIAFTVDDALAIVFNNPEERPRHPRTWRFLPEEEYQEKVALWEKHKDFPKNETLDPVARVLSASKNYMR